MTYWETLTTDNISSRFSAMETAAFTAMGSGPDQLAGLLEDTVDAVRGKIKAGGGQVGPDGMTPKSLKREIVSIVIWDWLTAYSRNDKLQTDSRKNKYTEAIAKLDKVGNGQVKVELPDPGQADTQAAPVNAFVRASGDRRQFTRRKLNRL